MLTLYVSEDNVVLLEGLYSDSLEAYLNAATVTYQLKLPSGTVVISGSMTYVTASDGDYKATIQSTVALSCGQMYNLEITIVQGSDNGFRKIQAKAQHHGES